MSKILEYLKKRGECLDADVAAALGLTLDETRGQLAELAAKKEVMLCQSTRFVKGKPVVNTICRISGFIPQAKPGAKPRVNLKLS